MLRRAEAAGDCLRVGRGVWLLLSGGTSVAGPLATQKYRRRPGGSREGVPPSRHDHIVALWRGQTAGKMPPRQPAGCRRYRNGLPRWTSTRNSLSQGNRSGTLHGNVAAPWPRLQLMAGSPADFRREPSFFFAAKFSLQRRGCLC